MRINPVMSKSQNSPAFGSVYVTTSTKNHGDYVDNTVIQPFQPVAKKIAGKNSAKYQELKDTTDCYVLGAGEGTRFRQLAKTQGDLVNKISFGLPLLNEDGKPTGKELHMLDIPMSMAAPLMDEKGLIRKNAEVARGSFAEVVDNAKKLRTEGKPQKNVIVMCGDNLFDTKDDPFQLLDFCSDIINNPNKQMGLIGVERTPEEVVNKFGVLKVAKGDKDGTYKLEGFKEKPTTVEIANEYKTPNGNCVANTGMFVIKAEAMDWLLDEIENDSKFIANTKKPDTEPYDFSSACTKVQEKYGKEKCDVKTVGVWEDAGEPDALYRTIAEYQKGNFIACMPEDLQKQIKNSAATIYDGTTLLSTPESIEKWGNAKNFSNLGFKAIDSVMVACNDDNKKGINLEA